MEYIDAETHEVVHIDYFHDPYLFWNKEKQRAEGGIYSGHLAPEWISKFTKRLF